MESVLDFLLLAVLSWLYKPSSCKLVLGKSGDNCKLWIPPEFRNLKRNGRVDVGPQSTLLPVSPVQIGVYVEHTQWIQFEGCTSQLHDGSCAHRLSGQTDPIVECYDYCNKTIFSLFNKCCYCKEYEHRASNLCSTKHCFPNYTGFCGEYFNGNNLGCFCQYRPIEKKVSDGPYNCMALHHTLGQMGGTRAESCDTALKYFGERGKNNREYLKSSWWTAASKIQRDEFFFVNETYLKRGVALKRNTLYWIGVFRKHMLVTERSNTVEFCGMLVRDSGGSVRFKIKQCNNSLPGLCVIDGESSPVPPPPSLTSNTQTIPVNGCTPGHAWNTTGVIPTEKDDGVICISTAGIIVIGIVILSLLVTFVVGFVINCRKAKTSELVRNSNVSTESTSPLEMRQFRNEPQDGVNNYNQLNLDEIGNRVYQEIAINAEVN